MSKTKYILFFILHLLCKFCSNRSTNKKVSKKLGRSPSGDLPNFWVGPRGPTFLFVDRFEQNLHSICKMRNKIYFAQDIFPVFFVVFFLFTILWTNCNKIVITQIPKALSVLVLGKKQRVFWKEFRKFSLAVFLNFDFVFSQVLPEITIYKNSNFIQLSPLSLQLWKN